LPTPRTSPTPLDRPFNGGVLNSRAISLPVPTYPTIAKQVGAQGPVTVQVLVDERGNVVSAKAISGNPLLRSAAEAAARQSRISPARVGEQNVKTMGLLLYNFRNN
jgi:protein TonB